MRFDELDVDDQLNLCLEVFRALVAARARDICSTAQVREETTAGLWRRICHEASLQECDPWAGYPHSLLPAEGPFWSGLAVTSDASVRRRVRALQDLMLACLGPSRPQ